MMEIVAVLTMAKNMGFDVGHIISLFIMYFFLRRDVKKGLLKEMKELIAEQFASLIGAIKALEESHNARLKKIEDHVGLQ